MHRVDCERQKNSCGKIRDWRHGWQESGRRGMWLIDRTRGFGWSKRYSRLCRYGEAWTPHRARFSTGAMAVKGMWILFSRRRRASWGWKSKLRRLSPHRMGLGFGHYLRPCPKEGHFYAGSCFMAGVSRDHSGGKSLPYLGIICCDTGGMTLNNCE